MGDPIANYAPGKQMRTSCIWDRRGGADVARKARGSRHQWKRSGDGAMEIKEQERKGRRGTFIKPNWTSQKTCSRSFMNATLSSENPIILITTALWEIHQFSLCGGDARGWGGGVAHVQKERAKIALSKDDCKQEIKYRTMCINQWTLSVCRF